MKKFLQQLILFTLVLLVINVVIYKVGYQLYYKRYFSPKTTFETYMLADSHGGRLGNLTEAYGIFNFSIGGDSYEDMYNKLSYLVKHTPVKTIYISVDDHQFSPSKDLANNTDRSVIFTSYDNYSNSYTYLKTKYAKRYIPLLQPKLGKVLKGYCLSKLKKTLKKEGMQEHSEKKQWHELPPQVRFAQSKLRADYFFKFDYASQKSKQTLLKIITVCRQNNIEIIGVKFPLSQDYIPLAQRSDYNASTILKSKGYPVLDFTTVFRDRNDYFANQDHLNKSGAKAFVDLLAKSKVLKTAE